MAWFLAHDVLGHQRGIFAPIGAVFILSYAPGRPSRRVFEIVVGAALGVAVGDLLIAGIGAGPVQVSVVTLLVMGTAAAVGANPAVATQAGIASVLIATVQPPHGIYSSLAAQRFVDVLVGGGLGLAVSIVFPRNPITSTREAATPFFAELNGTLDDVAAALDAHGAVAAEEALERARRLDGHVLAYQQALELAQETARLAPIHWRRRHAIARHAHAARRLEPATRNVRVLARAAVRAVELEREIPADLVLAVRELACAVRLIESDLEQGRGGAEARETVLRSAGRASLLIRGGGSLSVTAVVAQVRFTTTDLLQALGLDSAEAISQVRSAAELLLRGESREDGPS